MAEQKILILGSSGSLGKALVAQFTVANISFIEANRKNSNKRIIHFRFTY